MQKLLVVTVTVLLCAASLVGCVPITAAGSRTSQPLDQAAVQQAHDQLVGAIGAYTATERVVDFRNQGQKVVGTLTVPDGGNPPYPVVLFFTGFTGIRDEVPITGTDEGIFSRTARRLAEHGIASLRFDFRGFGDSEGQRESLTLTGEINDASAAIDYLATLPEIDLQRLGLIGLSLGGLVAAETAARDPRVQSVVLWSPLASPPDTFKLLLGVETVASGLQSGGEPVRILLPWNEEIDLSAPFFEDIYTIDPVAAMSTVNRPLLVVVGLRDVDVTPQPYYGQLYLNYHEGVERLVPVDGDHLFDVMTDQGPAVLDDVIAWSLAWLQKTL
jgi:dienelactone hydrolase